MSLDPKIWGPHYWFVLHTIALTYPNNPNETIKKKYYDFFQNLPLFLPVDNISKGMINLLDDYPITPYLDSRESLIKWLHFIHNKINFSLGIKEISLEQSLSNYYDNYKPKEEIVYQNLKIKEKYLYFAIILILFSSSLYLYKK